MTDLVVGQIRLAFPRRGLEGSHAPQGGLREGRLLAPSLGDDVDTTETAREVVDAIPPHAFPALMRVAGEYANKPYDEAAVFDFGLGLILDGLEDLLESDLSNKRIEHKARR